MLSRRIRLALASVAGISVVALGAASSGPVKTAWQYGELRSAKSAVDVRFVTSAEATCLTPPEQVHSSATGSKLYFIDLLTDAGWQIVSVDQTDRDWVYLMRRAR